VIYGIDKECEPGASPDRGEDERKRRIEKTV
jgi:hypothetical protein